MRLFCATLFPFILILSTGCLVLQSSCNKVHLRATTTSTHRSVTVHFHCMQNNGQDKLFIKTFILCSMEKKCHRGLELHGIEGIVTNPVHGLPLLTTRGHSLTTWTLALHYCCTSPQTTIPTIHCTDDTQLIALTTHS